MLVGIHRHRGTLDGPIPADTLRTVWLASSGVRAAEVNGLLLPRRSGFWWLTLVSSCLEEPHLGFDDDKPTGSFEVELEDELHAWPVGGRPLEVSSTGCAARDVHCVIDRRISIDWVWPELISLNRGGKYSCGAHPDADIDYSISSIDDPSTPLPLASVLGDAAGRRFREAFERARLEQIAVFPDCDRPTFSPASWHLVHENFRWKVEGWSATHRLCGVGIDYTIDADLTPFTRTANPFVSPDGRRVLTRVDEVLRLSSRDTPASPVARMPLSDDDSIVMVEWTVGRNVARWRDQVARLATPAR